MLSGEESLGDWDARKYPKCRPFHGKKGVQWENFVRDFGCAKSNLGVPNDPGPGNNTYLRLKECMNGLHPGGDIPYAREIAQWEQDCASRRA